MVGHTVNCKWNVLSNTKFTFVSLCFEKPFLGPNNLCYPQESTVNVSIYGSDRKYLTERKGKFLDQFNKERDFWLMGALPSSLSLATLSRKNGKNVRKIELKEKYFLKKKKKQFKVGVVGFNKYVTIAVFVLVVKRFTIATPTRVPKYVISCFPETYVFSILLKKCSKALFILTKQQT